MYQVQAYTLQPPAVWIKHDQYGDRYYKYVMVDKEANYLHEPINEYCTHAGIYIFLNSFHEIYGRPFLCLESNKM